MKYTEIKAFPLEFDEYHFVYDWKNDGSSLHIYLKSRPHRCACPDCGHLSNALNSTYDRFLQDTPIRGKQTFLHVKAYKYKCTNPQCKRRVFTEPLTFARHSQIRTDALTAMILEVSFGKSAEETSRNLAQMGVTVSGDSILRIYRRFRLPDKPDVEKIGVDDIAIRKGQTYATVVYDALDHHPMAIFKGRDGVPLAEWLKEHNKVKLVVRDRQNSYAEAIRATLPDCIQVADRFHLFQNLVKELSQIARQELADKLWLKDGKLLKQAPKKERYEKKPDLQKMAALSYDASKPLNPDGTETIFDSRFRHPRESQRKNREESIKKKQELIRNIQKRAGEMGKPQIPLLSKEFRITYDTAKKYCSMTEEEIIGLGHKSETLSKDSIMADWTNIIYKMMRDGIDDATIYHYLRYRKAQVKLNTIWDYMHCIEENNFPNRVPKNQIQIYEWRVPDDVIAISRGKLLKYLLTVNPKVKKDKKIRKNIRAIKQAYPVADRIHKLFLEFHKVLMGKKEEEIDKYIRKYGKSEIRSFCQSIKKDIVPVKNAISFDESSGFVEGNNNKLKLIKRSVYGRMKLVNLFSVSCINFIEKEPDFDINQAVLNNFGYRA